MSISRRDFMKVFGVSLAASILAGCRMTNGQPTTTPTIKPAWQIRQKIRLCWLCFDELDEKTSSGQNGESDECENPLGQQWIATHRAALDELAAVEGIESPVADLVHEAYQAAVRYVWESNIPNLPSDIDIPNIPQVTCDFPIGPVITIPNYNARLVVEQARSLNELATQGDIDPATLAQMQAALAGVMNYYTLSQEEAKAYGRGSLSPFPTDMEISPKARAAAEFLAALLTTTE